MFLSEKCKLNQINIKLEPPPIPKLQTKEQFEIYVKKRLKNVHRTHVPVMIKKVRVVDATTLNNDIKND